MVCSDINGDLTVINAESNYEEYFIRNTGWYPGDMAYNPVDGYIYAVVNINKYKLKDPVIYSLLRIDKLTGETTVAGTLPMLTNSLACDQNGTFYCNKYETSEVYSFTLNDLAEPTLICEITDTLYPESLQAMEWDYNKNVLRWAVGHVSGWRWLNGFTTIDVSNGTWNYLDTNGQSYEGLVIPTDGAKTGSWADSTQEISTILLSETSATILRNSELRLTANVLPWTVTDRTVNWSSTNPAVASVDSNGKVTAISVGEADIIATSVLDADVMSVCHVTVEALDMTLTGITRNTNGEEQFFTWDMAHEDRHTPGVSIDTALIAATEIPDSNNVYVVDDYNGIWGIHKVDMLTGKGLQRGRGRGNEWHRFRSGQGHLP